MRRNVVFLLFATAALILSSIIPFLQMTASAAPAAPTVVQFENSPSNSGLPNINNLATEPSLQAATLQFTDAADIKFSVQIPENQTKDPIGAIIANGVNISGTMTDSDIWDGDYNYKSTAGGCTSQFTLKQLGNGTQLAGIVQFGVSDPSDGNKCVYAVYAGTVDNTGNLANAYFQWQSKTQMTAIQGGYTLTEDSSNPQGFTGVVDHDIDNEGCGTAQFGCKITSTFELTVAADNSTATGTLVITSNHNSLYNYQAETITYSPTVILGTRSNTTTTTPPGGGNDEDTSAPTIDCHAGFNPLNWLVCGVIDGLTKIVNSVDSLINSQLSVGTSSGSSDSPSEIFGTGQTATDYHQSWSYFRDIALGLMVIAGLVVIIAQALGLEVLDAYTIRKVLPRLIIVAIAITLSWNLMEFFVKLTNDLGFGIRGLIYAPFTPLGKSININLGGTQGLAVSLATGAAITALGIFGLLSFVATAALAVFVAFLVLIIRQILVVVLILVAPLALVAYILPNTQNVYKLWWESFSKALLMFPIIAAMIAAGRVFSAVAIANGPNNPFNQFIAFAAYFAPYFLLPATFKFAGGALRQIGGFVNDRHRGAFDRVRNFRGDQVKKNTEAIKAGKRWQGNRVGERLSRGLQTGSLLGQAGYNPLQMRSRVRSARSTRISTLSADADKSAAVRSVLGNDDLLAASVNGSGTEADSRAYLQSLGQRGDELEQNVASIRQAKRDMGRVAFEDFAAANLAGTGTGYRGGPAEMFDTINRVAGSDRARAARILNSARGQAERAKRVDLYGAGFATSADQMSQLYNSATTGATAASVNEAMTDEALLTKSAGEIASGRNNALGNMIGTQAAPGAVLRRLARAQAARTQAYAAGGGAPTAAQQVVIDAAEHQYKRVVAHTASMLDIAGSVSPENAQMIGERVMGMNVNGVTLAAEIERLRPDAEFTQYRREYSSAATAAGVAAATPAPPTPPPSDRRLKRDITYIKTLENGIRLYSFQYIWGGPTYVGVMAQDLLTSHPYAVGIDSNGYYNVDYAALGLKMMKLEDWELLAMNQKPTVSSK